MTTSDRIDRLTGALLGTAVGDALGLPREGSLAAELSASTAVARSDTDSSSAAA
jgi:ADP-ribosylglycohydrolase